MNTPSARPPSSARRFESLDSEAARRFVSGASREGSSEPPAPAVVPPLQPAEPAPAARPEPPAATTPRREPMRVLTVRIPESLHARLDFIARNSPHSMNSFVQAALEPAIATEIEKINKRKAMGLD
ncbi:MAG: toxin-antitoxin system HicB family antitoxin [Gammaproteobacteria bacterium]